MKTDFGVIFMKRILILTSAFVVLAVGGPAVAADIPPPAPMSYKTPVPPPLYNWTGFYLGGNLGYGFTSSSTLSDSQLSGITNTSSSAFLGGGQVGVNWEFGGGVVIGAEADFEWLPNTKNTVNLNGAGGNLGSTATATINSRWLTLADARLGYAWDRLLVYGKGGGAFVGANNSSLNVSPSGAVLPLSGPANNMGWNAGAGLEYAFWGTWSAKVEYDYIRLNSASFTAAGAGGPFNLDVISANNRVINMVTVGLNYKFGPWF